MIFCTLCCFFVTSGRLGAILLSERCQNHNVSLEKVSLWNSPTAMMRSMCFVHDSGPYQSCHGYHFVHMSHVFIIWHRGNIGVTMKVSEYMSCHVNTSFLADSAFHGQLRVGG